MVAGNGSGGVTWRKLGRRELFSCRVFTVTERENEAPDGRKGHFAVLEAPDWATVVPLIDGPAGPSFLMVRQYRHGSDEVSLEFPGGVVEPGEAPEAAAARELSEETAHRAGRLVHAGSLSPNPAIMANRFHVYVAFDLKPEGSQNLDEHEVVDALVIPVEEVRAHMGEPPYSHALMVCALYLADRVIASGS
jgi:8-oxo-dGTP pyrophosphatase MutT (NUDIX family)